MMRSRLGHELTQAKAMFEPVVDADDALFQARHGLAPSLSPCGCTSPIWIRASFATGFFAPGQPATCLVPGLATVGRSPTLMIKLLESILYAYSNRPRSGGPEAREPS